MSNTKNNTKNTGKVLTDSRKRWLPGTASPNPHGRPPLTPVQRYLRKAAGEVTEDLFNILIELAVYDQTDKKDRWEKVKPADRLRALELLLAYAHGKPTQHVEAQIETKSINVQVKMPDDFNITDI